MGIETESMVVNTVNTVTLTLEIAGFYQDEDYLIVNIPGVNIEFVGIGEDLSNCESVSILNLSFLGNRWNNSN